MRSTLLDRPTTPALAPTRPMLGTNRSVRKASTTAGVGLLAMSVLSAFGYLFAVKGVVAPANAARTSTNLAGHEGLFGFGILSLYVVAALDVVVACALYRVFKPVSAGLSRLAAGLRIAYAVVFMVAISQLVEALRVHTQALRHINSFTNIWDAGLVLFGLNLVVLAYMAYRSGYVPKLLGLLLAIAGFGYVFDTVVRALVQGSSSESPRSRAWVSSCSHFGLWSGDAGWHCAARVPTPSRLEQDDDGEK